MFEIGNLPSLDLGYQGENKVRTIDIDMTAWLEEYPGSKVALMVKRPDEDTYYPAGKMEGTVLLWVIDRADRLYAGRGEAQVILKGADDIELRTRVVKTKISPSLSGTEVEAPPPHATWVGKVLDAAATAEAAVEKMPSIGENGNWYAWDAAAGAYVDTGKPSKGKDGEDGYTPQKDVDYFDGKDGEDGFSPVVEVIPITGGHRVTITDENGQKTFDVMNGNGGGGSGNGGENGGYYIPAVVDAILSWTPSKADMPTVPSADIKGPKGDAGYTPVKGKDYFDGKNGEDGYTPVKGKDYFDGKDAFTAAVAVNVLSTAWTGDAAPYTATVACNGVTADNHIIVGTGGALTADQQAAMAAAMIVCTGQGANSITLSAFGEVPDIDLPVNVMIVG